MHDIAKENCNIARIRPWLLLSILNKPYSKHPSPSVSVKSAPRHLVLMLGGVNASIYMHEGVRTTLFLKW